MSEEKRFLDSAGLKKAFELIKQSIAEKYISKAEGIGQIAQIFGYTPANPTEVTEEINAAKTAVEEQLAADKEELEGKIAAVDEKADGIDAKVDALDEKVDQAVEDLEETVASEVAKIVAGADEKYDTLKEIADFILSDTTGAAKMANDIARLDGDETVEGSVKQQIKTAVDAEAERAEESEGKLQDAIDAEAERAEAKEAELEDAIKAEQARAEEAEAKLQAEYDSIDRITEPVIIALFEGAQVAMTNAEGEVKVYDTIEEAIAEAVAGDVIELAEDIELTENLKVADGVTIVANGKVIVC